MIVDVGLQRFSAKYDSSMDVGILQLEDTFNMLLESGDNLLMAGTHVDTMALEAGGITLTEFGSRINLQN